MPTPLKTLKIYLDSYGEDERRAFKDYLHTATPYNHSWSQALYPFSERFFSKVNPLLLFETERWTDVGNLLPVVLAKDGLYPLAKFFLQTPKPPTRCPIILLHEHFLSIVPKAWLGKILLYRHQMLGGERSFELPGKEEAIVIKGLVNSSFSSIEHKKQIFSKVQADAAKSKKEIKVLIYNLLRDDVFLSRSNDEHFHYHFEAQLSALPKARPIFSDNFSPVAQRATVVYDYQEKFACIADDHSMHRIVSSGGRPHFCEERKVEQSEIYLPLSPFHGYVISEPQGASFNKDIQSEVEKLYRIFSSKTLTSDFFRTVNKEISFMLPDSKWYCDKH